MPNIPETGGYNHKQIAAMIRSRSNEAHEYLIAIIDEIVIRQTNELSKEQFRLLVEARKELERIGKLADEAIELIEEDRRAKKNNIYQYKPRASGE